jgi:REP element-mobilizing transposase RayT
MNPARPIHKGRLRRLPSGHYRGLAWVHWTMNLADRATGWLDPLHHARLREILCHALAREELVCAAYCLMPDHAHFLIGGLSSASDQRNGIKAFRKA